MFCTIINDCADNDAIGRQGTRVASLIGVAPTFVGVGTGLTYDNRHDPAEIEAAGCLIDVLDAAEGREGLVLVNCANRHSKGKKWPNGTPFGYFRYQKTLVVSTIDGYVLSLVKRLGLVQEVCLLDVPTVMQELAKKGIVTAEVAQHVSHTQFRSFDFTPRVGAYLIQGGEVPFEKLDISSIEDLPLTAWFVDNFGNVKTTILPIDVEFAVGDVLQTRWGEFPYYTQLKDVPNGERGCTMGSSGIEDKRFLELTIQGKSAARELKIAVGDLII